MKRRSFLKSLASMLIAATVARKFGAIGIDAGVISDNEEKPRYVVNPEWVKAPYEVAIIMGMGAVCLRHPTCPLPVDIVDPDGPRFIDDGGRMIQVPKFVPAKLSNLPA